MSTRLRGSLWTSNRSAPGRSRTIPKAVPFLALLVACPLSRGQTILRTLDGDEAGDVLGWSVSGAGDVNADGFADVIVSIALDDHNGPSSGSARVYSGPDGTTLYTFHGDSAEDFFGTSVSGAGDVNVDGYADLIVGAPFDDDNGTDAGSARVFSGRDGRTLYTFHGDSPFDTLGIVVRGAGDVNADGHADLVVGIPGDDENGPGSGSARVFSGRDGTILHTFFGGASGDGLGLSVSGAGDVDGDGHADVIVGAPRETGFSGSARVFSGRNGATLHNFEGDAPGDWLGASVDGVGDVNGDGWPDLVVGALLADSSAIDAGKASVYSGRDGAVLIEVAGDTPYGELGRSVGGAGDVDGDGYADVVVGAGYDDANGFRSGKLRIVSGATGADLYAFVGDAPLDALGWSVGGAGDVNGDGYADVIAGAPDDDNHGSQSGSARLFSLYSADAPGLAYCFGVGCPCANHDPQAGCVNSTGHGGLLASQGSNRLGLEDLSFDASRLVPGQPVLLFAGTDSASRPAGDGLDCVGGAVTLVGVQRVDGLGQARWGPGLGGSIGAFPGQTRYFQAWYRDPAGSPCGSGFNTSQGLSMVLLR